MTDTFTTIPAYSRNHNSRRLSRTRRGSVFGLFTVLLPVLCILAAMSINSAYMQLASTELMVTTDLAAQAGGRALSQYQDVDMALAAAQATAALNTVAGQPLQLNTSDSSNQVEFGKTNNTSGNYTKFTFQKINTANVRNRSERASAMRITGKRNSSSLGGPIHMIFPTFVSRTTFEPTFQSVAMQVDRDVSLVIDRSGSMGELPWPSNKNPYTTNCYKAAVTANLMYKSGNNYYLKAGVTAWQFENWAWQTYFHLGTVPHRPWEDCVSAVNSFLDVLAQTPQEEKVSVASYSSTGTLNCQLTATYASVRSIVGGLSPSGSTAIGYGMQAGAPAFANVAARPYAAKTMVVMTDGIQNTGTNPVTVATTLMGQYPLTIHTVTFGPDADITRMQQIATIGGGNHYHAATGADLVPIFEEIANNVATITTQ